MPGDNPPPSSSPTNRGGWWGPGRARGYSGGQGQPGFPRSGDGAPLEASSGGPARGSPFDNTFNRGRGGRGRGFDRGGSGGGSGGFADRGRGRGRGRGSFSTTWNSNRFPEPPPQPGDRKLLFGLLSPNLEEIRLEDVKNGGVEEEVKMKNFRAMGSYNWVEAAVPTLVSPGIPPAWHDRQLPFSVEADQGFRIVDHCALKMKNNYNLLPLIAAVEDRWDQPDEPFPWGNYSFITDRNNLRKLIRWITQGEQPANEFRIDLYLAGEKTILMDRWDKRYRDVNSGYTFGNNFELATAEYPKDGNEYVTYHRIVQYKLNDLPIMVRCELDAYLPSPSDPPLATPSHQVTSADDLADTLAGLSMQRSHPPAPPSYTLAWQPSPTLPKTQVTSVKIIKSGTFAPQSSVVEMTTRSIKRRQYFDWTEDYPQLFFSQVPHHFLATHEAGNFHKIEKRRMALSTDDRATLIAAAAGITSVDPETSYPHPDPVFTHEAEKFQPTLRKLYALLRHIQDFVVQNEGLTMSGFTLVCEGGKLKIYERDMSEEEIADLGDLAAAAAGGGGGGGTGAGAGADGGVGVDTPEVANRKPFPEGWFDRFSVVSSDPESFWG